MQAQSGAASVQMVICGAMRFGSSSAPARMKIRCGRDRALLNNGVPQVGQNPRLMRLPLLAMLSNHFTSPSTDTASLRKHTLTAPFPAPKYWQTRHQQVRDGFSRRNQALADRFRAQLADWYPADKAAVVRHAEGFELCEYGAQPDKAQLWKLFPFFD